MNAELEDENELYCIVVNWTQNTDTEKLKLIKEDNKYTIIPVNERAVKIILWVSSRKNYISLSAGRFSWWADNIKLERKEKKFI